MINVTLNENTLTLMPNKTGKLTATVKPDDADNKMITWSSSDETVATVDNDGTVKAVKKGTAIITAQVDGKTAECTVTVEVPTMTNGTIDDYGVLTKYTGDKKTVFIPDGVTSIGNEAFKDCENLTDVRIPDSVTSIDMATFVDCSKLESVTIHSSVTSIGNMAFTNCGNLKTVIYDGTKAEWNNETKDTDWDSSTGTYTIKCTNGNLDKSGSS